MEDIKLSAEANSMIITTRYWDIWFGFNLDNMIRQGSKDQENERNNLQGKQVEGISCKNKGVLAFYHKSNLECEESIVDDDGRDQGWRKLIRSHRSASKLKKGR